MKRKLIYVVFPLSLFMTLIFCALILRPKVGRYEYYYRQDDITITETIFDTATGEARIFQTFIYGKNEIEASQSSNIPLRKLPNPCIKTLTFKNMIPKIHEINKE